MNPIIAAVLSSLSYAIGDNANGVISKKNTPLTIAYWSGIYSILLFFVPLLLFFRHEIGRVTVSSALIMVGLGLLVNVGFITFIAAMRKGSIILTGVIAGASPAVTTVLALLFYHEHLTGWEVIAILVVFLGVTLSSLHGSAKQIAKEFHSSGTFFALVACAAFGAYFAFVRTPITEVGWFMPLYFTDITGAIMFFIVIKYSRDKIALKTPNSALLLIAIDIIQMAGSLFYTYAISRGQTSLVAPIAGSSPAIFALMAFFIFKERLNRTQTIGIVLAITGTIGLSVLSIQ